MLNLNTLLLPKLKNFLKFSVGSLGIFSISLVVFNFLVYVLNDKVLAAQYTLIITYFNYLCYYYFAYKIKKRVMFFLYYNLNSLIFRVLEFFAIKYLLILGFNHNVCFIFVLVISHFLKYLLLRYFRFI